MPLPEDDMSWNSWHKFRTNKGTKGGNYIKKGYNQNINEKWRWENTIKNMTIPDKAMP